MNTEHKPRPSESLRRGDHIRAGRPGAPHHDGIYLGDGHVIHLTGIPGGGKADARVRTDTLATFAAGRPVTVRPYAGIHDPDAIIARAVSRLGDGNYHLIFNNCQHFARWCATGDARSEQVSSVAATTGTFATPVVAAAVGLNVVGSAGLVAGLSGPGIMSGLAAYGALVGGGVVAGMVTLSAAPGLTSIAIMNRALREDDDLPGAERAARTAGRGAQSSAPWRALPEASPQSVRSASPALAQPESPPDSQPSAARSAEEWPQAQCASSPRQQSLQPPSGT